VILLLLGLTGLQAQKTIYVMGVDGNQTTVVVEKIEFPSLGTITVKTPAGSISVPTEEIRYVSFVDFTSSIPPLPETSKGNIRLFPNPAVDVLNIQLMSASLQSATIEILSIDGKVVYAQKINSQNNLVDVSFLSRGLYLCRFNNGTIVETVKFLKQ